MEKDGDHFRVFKRPGKAVIWSLDANATTGQGMTMFNGVPFAVVFDNVAFSECLVFPAGPPNSGSDGTAWTLSSTGPWAPRNFAACFAFNSQMYVIGGQESGANAQDVWVTSDGVNWAQHGAVPFDGGYRFNFGYCVFNGAIYLFGGVGNAGPQNDVWRSTDGVNWTQIIAAAPWSVRYGMSVIATSAGMFLMGGNSGGTTQNDVWFSPDGSTWNPVQTSAIWSARQLMMSWYFNNAMFIGGGNKGATVYNDVWTSTNGGVSWTQLTGAAWAQPSNGGIGLVYNNKMWVFGGTNAAGNHTAAIYSSPTGVTWTNVGSLPMGACGEIGAAVFQVPATVSTGRYQTMWLMGGDTAGFTLLNTTYRANLNITLTNAYPLNPNSSNLKRYDFQAFSNNTQLLIKNDLALFVADQGGVQRVWDQAYPPVTVPGMVVLGDSVYVMDPTGLIFGSPNSNPYSWPAENRIPADYESDPGVAIAKYLSYLVAFGTYTTQFFYDAGIAPGSALLPYLSAPLQVGCYSASTVQQFDKNVIWMSQDKSGLRQVMMFNGLTAVPISTPGIEKMIAQGYAPTAYSSDVIMYANHSFYLLTVTNSQTGNLYSYNAATTLVYDLTTKEWVRWENGINDVEGFGFMMGGSSTNLSFSGQNSYFLSPQNGNVYSLGSLYADNVGTYYFALQGAKIDGGNNNNKFWGPMELIGDKQAGTVDVQFTDDDYNTWSAKRSVDMNTSRPILYRNGASRRRAITLTQLDDKPRAIEFIEFQGVEQGGDVG